MIGLLGIDSGEEVFVLVFMTEVCLSLRSLIDISCSGYMKDRLSIEPINVDFIQ